LTRHNPVADGPLQTVEGGVLLYVTAFPKAKRDEIAGVRNGRLLVKITAPPEDGKANEAIIKLLGQRLGFRGRIELRNGSTSRAKTFYLEDASLESIQAVIHRLQEP
jgi:uncharacterized protein